MPVVIATGAATTIGRILIGPNPAFAVSDIQLSLAQAIDIQETIAFVLLGMLCGVASWAFIRLLVVMEDGFPKLPGNVYTQNIVGMAIIGLMMVALTHAFGHSYIDGVGYSVIQSILDQKMTDGEPVGTVVCPQIARHYHQPRLRRFRRHLFALAVSRRHARRGLRCCGRSASPPRRPDRSSAAIVGMAAMVGAGTGGVMTAIVMVFEMTRDYAIIVPVIVAVAVAAGVRRVTDRRDHLHHQIPPPRPSHPKERHINLYLVKQAQDIMERRFIVAKAGTTLKEAMVAEDKDDLRAIIVEREGRIVGLIPPRSGLWREARSNPDLLVERFVESRVVVCRDVDLLSLVFARLKRHRSGAAIIFHGVERPRVHDIVGIITKRAIADAVIDSYDD